ncbi:hypothetical protein [Bacillus sp. NEAU-Y102]
MCKKWVERLVTVMLVMIGALLGSYVMATMGISGASTLMRVLIVGLIGMMPIVVTLSITHTLTEYFRNKKMIKGK